MNGKPHLRFEWWVSRKRWLSAMRLLSLRNKHKGKRCFVIGNGPSLNKTDLSLLQNEISFGLNRIYLLFPKLGFQSTYYIAVNKLVIKQCSQEIASLTMPSFISWYARDFVSFDNKTIFLRDYYRKALDFSKNPIYQIWEGTTVTYVALQLAYFMGFQQAILIGVDHSFATQGEPHKVITSSGDDPNHFDPAYFGKGFQWQLPDLKSSERAYKLAKVYYENAGRQILDATIEGKLQVFPKVAYKYLFNV